jgi:hypothetical protein
VNLSLGDTCGSNDLFESLTVPKHACWILFGPPEGPGISHNGNQNTSRRPGLNVPVHPLWQQRDFRRGAMFDEIDCLSSADLVGMTRKEASQMTCIIESY